MRVLIVGGDGMLGHQLFKTLKPRHEVKVTLRKELEAYREYGLFDAGNAFGGVDARSTDGLIDVLGKFRPGAVVNCVGLVKQRDNTSDAIANLEINALFPHRLARLCAMSQARLVHLSTDCVFSGDKGMYSESDRPDADDLYGQTKYLGEVAGPNCVTLRTSMIGRELSHKRGLLDWFLAQRGKTRGFTRAIFSGFTTIELSRVIEMVLVRGPEVSGLYHVSSEPIDKHALLELFRDHYRTDVEIEADDSVRIDRSLDSTCFRRLFGYEPPSWPRMVQEL